VGLLNRYEILDGQELFGQDVLNVYYYKQVLGSGGTAADLKAAYQGYMYPVLQAVQSVGLAHVAIAVRNLDDPTDFVIELVFPQVLGTVTGDSMPPFVAWAFRMNRTQLNVRNGWKRIGGVPEAGQNGGIPIAGYTPLLDDVAVTMGANLVSAGVTFEPRIMRKTVTPGPPKITTYTDFPMGTVQFTSISTQNTRKFGRGS